MANFEEIDKARKLLGNEQIGRGEYEHEFCYLRSGTVMAIGEVVGCGHLVH